MKNNSELIEKFLEAKYAEAGLSENSIFAYSRDLKKVCIGIKKCLLNATQTELEKYFVNLEKSGHSQSTRARHLSSIKQFYKFCVESGYVSTDPSSQLSGPKSSKSAPADFDNR